jgi:hypothetical protein
MVYILGSLQDKNRLKPGNKTVLMKHANEHGHTFDFDHSEILNVETNWYKHSFWNHHKYSYTNRILDQKKKLENQIR